MGLAINSCGPKTGTLETVAELKENPGNITVSGDGRIFISMHQFRSPSMKLAEVHSDGSVQAYPNKKWNRTTPGPQTLNAVLGVQVDSLGRLWALDNGLGENPQPPKLVAFDLDTNRAVMRYDFPAEVAPPGSFVNDLAVDAKRNFIYIADIGGPKPPGLVVVDLNKKKSWRYDADPSFQAEDKNVIVDGRIMAMGGQPARIGINPITLSGNGQTLYYGAMSGTKWYSLPTASLRKNRPWSAIKKRLKIVGPKPISDGASTDRAGNHYFTAIGQNAIIMLTGDGQTKKLVQDPRLSWPDALAFDGHGWLYIAVNQLHLSPALNNGAEGSTKPFLVMRVFTGNRGIVGR